MLVQMDWRPLVGLRDRDRGTVTERVITRAVMDIVIEVHRRENDAAK